MQLSKPAVAISAVVAVGAAMVVTSSPASADPAIAGTYNALSVTRMVDTRAGTGAPAGAVAAGSSVNVDLTAGITGSVSAVNVTITAITPTRSGYLTVYPAAAGTPRPGVATVNFAAGESAPNAAFVDVRDGGTVRIFNGSPGTVQITVDRSGYWTGGTEYGTGAFVPSAAKRIVDSRLGGGTPIPARSSRSVDVSGALGDVNADAVVLNLGAASPAMAGYLTAAGAATDQTDDSRTSTVSFSAGRSRSTLVAVPINSDGTISVFNGATFPVNYVADLVGYVTGDANGGGASDGGSVVIASPTRVADSRVDATPIPAKGSRSVQVVPADLPQGVFSALIVHVTATRTTAPGFLTAWNGTTQRPNTSVTNFTAGVARTGTVIVPVSSTGTISLYNSSTAPVSYVIDMQGLVVSQQTSELRQATAEKRIATTLQQIRTAAKRFNR